MYYLHLSIKFRNFASSNVNLILYILVVQWHHVQRKIDQLDCLKTSTTFSNY